MVWLGGRGGWFKPNVTSAAIVTVSSCRASPLDYSWLEGENLASQNFVRFRLIWRWSVFPKGRIPRIVSLGVLHTAFVCLIKLEWGLKGSCSFPVFQGMIKYFILPGCPVPEGISRRILEMLLTWGICSSLSPSSLCDMKSSLSSTSRAQFRFIISAAWRQLFPAVSCSAGSQLMAPLSFQDPR